MCLFLRTWNKGQAAAVGLAWLPVVCEKYLKIPTISPGAYFFQRPFLRGLFLEGLI